MEIKALEIAELSFEDLHILARLTEDFANNTDLPDTVGPWFYDLYRGVNDAFLERVPANPKEALAQVMILAADAAASEYRDGPMVVERAQATLAATEQLQQAG